MDLEHEISRKEIEQDRLSREMNEVRTLLVQQHRALESLKEQLSSERQHASEQLQAARQASEHLQEEQDAFLALLLDEHEQELTRLRRERDDALAQSAMAEHTRRRVSVEQDLAARIDWLRAECDEARRDADDARREADEAQRKIDETQRNADQAQRIADQAQRNASEAEQVSSAAERRAAAAEQRLEDTERALDQARGELEQVRRELVAIKRELAEARLGVAEAKSEAQDARRERDKSHEQRDRAVEEIERLRNLISGTDLRQRPTDPALQAATAALDPVQPELAEQASPVANRATPRVAPEVGKRDTSTAPAVPRPEPPSESKIALGRVDLRSSSSKLRPAAPVAETSSARQTKPTAPSMPAMRAAAPTPRSADSAADTRTPAAPPRASHDLETLPPPADDEPEFEVGYASADDVLMPLEEEQLETAALDMTRDLAWEGVDDDPAPTERRSSRPVGPAERPPVMRQKPMLERSPGGYSMPPDASGTIEVLHPLGPNKR